MSNRKLRSKCPCCEEYLREIDGMVICLRCGYEDLYYYINQANRFEPKEDEVPVGCEACGGPYPLCKDSCDLFDT